MTTTEAKPAEALPERDGQFKWAVPASFEVPPDPLRLRIDFHSQAVTMTVFDGEFVSTKMVSAMDVAHALSRELNLSSGLLPTGVLWWTNTPDGAVVAMYREPQVTKVALQTDVRKPPERYTIPMPGLIFICRGGLPPYVYAVKKRPTKPTDPVFKAPCFNVFANGRVCPGTHTFPKEPAGVPESFFVSFFSPTGDHYDRSKRCPQNLALLWKRLDGEDAYPNKDLIQHGRVEDLLSMEMSSDAY
jgi:hypothetical protein